MEASHLKSCTSRQWSEWVLAARPPCQSATPLRRALLISYQFPPVGGSGVQRPVKLAKYLPQFGWSVEVLTAAHDRFPWQDATLLQDVPPDCLVHHVHGYEPACVARRVASGMRFGGPRAKRWLEDRLYWRMAGCAARYGRGNGESWWVRPAMAAARKLHSAQPFDVVISTGPPHFVHLVALTLASKARVPWLADLRDPLVSDFDRGSRSFSQQQTQARLEQRILRHAAAIITTSQTFAAHLRQCYPARAADIRCIFNGFDRDDLRHGMESALPAPKRPECVLLASGSFYGRRELHRFLKPLADVLAAHPEWSDRVELRLVGTIDGQQARELAHGKPTWLTIGGYVDHGSAIRTSLQADCSIVIVPDCSHGRMSIPAKTFELTAVPRHVLGLVPAGSCTEEILRRAGAATCAPLEDEQAVARAFEQVISGCLAGMLPTERDWRSLEIYDRRFIAEQFGACLDHIAGREKVSAGPPEDGSESELILIRGEKRNRKAGHPVPIPLEAAEVP